MVSKGQSAVDRSTLAVRERRSLFAEKTEAMERSGQFVIYQVWRDQWVLKNGTTKYQRVSGYGLSIGEAAVNATARAGRLFRGKIVESYGGGYQVLHGSRWHSEGMKSQERTRNDE